MELLIFTRNGKKIPKLPQRPGIKFQHIQFESQKLDDLLKVAKYRIFEFPTSLILDNRGRILLRVRGSITNKYIDSIYKD